MYVFRIEFDATKCIAIVTYNNNGYFSIKLHTFQRVNRGAVLYREELRTIKLTIEIHMHLSGQWKCQWFVLCPPIHCGAISLPYSVEARRQNAKLNYQFTAIVCGVCGCVGGVTAYTHFRHSQYSAQYIRKWADNFVVVVSIFPRKSCGKWELITALDIFQNFI